MDHPRKEETEARYRAFKKTHEHDTARLESFDFSYETIIREFKLWCIIENRFPYDKMTHTNHMLVSKRPTESYYQANTQEQEEYHTIIQLLAQEGFYDAMIENFPKVKSVKKFAHIHLVKWHNTTP